MPSWVPTHHQCLPKFLQPINASLHPQCLYTHPQCSSTHHQCLYTHHQCLFTHHQCLPKFLHTTNASLHTIIACLHTINVFLRTINVYTHHQFLSIHHQCLSTHHQRIYTHLCTSSSSSTSQRPYTQWKTPEKDATLYTFPPMILHTSQQQFHLNISAFIHSFGLVALYTRVAIDKEELRITPPFTIRLREGEA